LVSHNKIVDNQVYEEGSVINDVSSNCYIETVLDDDDDKCNEAVLKLSSIDKLLAVQMGAIQVLPIDSGIFQRNFTPEEHFMINLCNICDEANAPLDLVNKTVGVVRDAQCNGLNMQSNIICSQEYFLKHLNDCFNTPSPETVYAKIEDQHGNEQMVAMI